MNDELKAETSQCSFCGYERPELHRIDNGIEKGEPGYGFGDFCTVCENSKCISAYFLPWDFRFDIEILRTMARFENKRMDDAAIMQSHLQYIRTMVNEGNSTTAALAAKIKSLEERLGR